MLRAQHVERERERESCILVMRVGVLNRLRSNRYAAAGCNMGSNYWERGR